MYSVSVPYSVLMSPPIAFRSVLIIVIVSFASSLPYGAKIIPSPGPKTRGPDMYGLYGYIQTVDCIVLVRREDGVRTQLPCLHRGNAALMKFDSKVFPLSPPSQNETALPILTSYDNTYQYPRGRRGGEGKR